VAAVTATGWNRPSPRVVETGMRRTALVLLALVTVVAGGCAGPRGSDSPGGPVQVDESAPERARQQAREALARWEAAVAGADIRQPRFVPIGEQTGQIGQWEPEVGDNNKAALGAGLVDVATTLPETSHPGTVVRWAAGGSRTVETISAMQALRQRTQTGQGAAGCPRCRPLRVIGATATTVEVETSRGVATAPAWAYRLEGTAVRMTRLAVNPTESVTVTPPPWDPMNRPAGLSVELATTTLGSTRLEVAFTGAKDGADRPCGVDYVTEAVESTHAVVVILLDLPYTGSTGVGSATGDGMVGCAMIGYRRTATVELAEPLGDRTVLEVVQGMPVPVTITR
jgi:hypothetical protein